MDATSTVSIALEVHNIFLLSSAPSAGSAYVVTLDITQLTAVGPFNEGDQMRWRQVGMRVPE